MKRGLCPVAVAFLPVLVAAADEPQVHRRTLDNGIRVTYLHVPGSKSLSMFTYLPLGVAADGPGQTQWSHLLEHMVLRTTVPDTLRQANAETLTDHMRLDYYGTVKGWPVVLSHHKRWLAGLPLSAERLNVEKRRANAEVDYTAKNLVCHKFAVAAWNQVMRHGRRHVGVKGDLAGAPLDELERYRQRRLVVLGQTSMCAVGGSDPERLLFDVADQIGGIQSVAAPPAHFAGLKPRNTKATWDLPTRHLLLTWPTAGVEKSDVYAALMAAAQTMMVRAAADSQLTALCGPVLAGADLASPEGNHVYLSATLRPGADAGAAQRRLERLGKLDGNSDPILASAGKQLAALRQPSLLEILKRQMPDSSKAEAQFGLMWGMDDFRLGSRRAALARNLERQTAHSIRAAIKKYLRPETRSTLLLVEERPAKR